MRAQPDRTPRRWSSLPVLSPICASRRKGAVAPRRVSFFFVLFFSSRTETPTSPLPAVIPSLLQTTLLPQSLWFWCIHHFDSHTDQTARRILETSSSTNSQVASLQRPSSYYSFPSFRSTCAMDRVLERAPLLGSRQTDEEGQASASDHVSLVLHEGFVLCSEAGTDAMFPSPFSYEPPTPHGVFSTRMLWATSVAEFWPT